MQIVSQDSVCIVSDFYQVTEEMHFKSAILLYKLSDINDKGRKSFTVVLSGSKMSWSPNNIDPQFNKANKIQTKG